MQPWKGRKVVGVFAHPDDEAYAAGGLLALCARNGATVTVVSATRGERGTARDPDFDGRSMIAARTAELTDSCRALGAGPPRFLDLPDGAVDGTDEVAAGLLTDLLRGEAPDLVVTLGPDGAYGHKDHIACTALALEATDGLRRVRVLGAAFPKAVFRPVWRNLRRAPGALVDPSLSGSDLGIDPARADLRLDVRPVRDAKLAAIAAHRSQLSGGDPMTLLLPDLVAPLLDEELYVVLAGPAIPAGAADPFRR